MRKSLPGTARGFCTICGRSQCDGYGDGINIPDHTPDMDSVEEGGSTTVYCNICGKSVTHDWKGNPDDGPTWREVVDAWYEGPDEIGSNHENDDDVDFCKTCWETVIKPLFKICEKYPYRGLTHFVQNGMKCEKCPSTKGSLSLSDGRLELVCAQCGWVAYFSLDGKRLPGGEPLPKDQTPAWGNMAVKK